MTRKTTSRTMLSALAVALGSASLAVLPAFPTVAQEAPAQDTAPAAQPVANKGPVVVISDATFPAGRDHEHTFTITDPENEGVQTAYWNPTPGFELEYVRGNTWKLEIDDNVAPGEYNFEIQGEDIHGKIGAPATATITISGDTPQPQPTGEPEPPATQGPVVRVQGGTFDNRRENKIPFTVDDPQGDRIHQVWWYPIPGATLRFVEDNRWEVVIPRGAKVGTHNLRIWATDVNGNKGPVANVRVVIHNGNPQDPDQPKPNPDPGVNSGPVVQVSPGTYDNRQRNVIPFKVVDPDGDFVRKVWWYPLPNSTLRHVDDDNWEIIMEPGVRPGNYPLRIWAMDDKGNKGAESNVNIRVVGNKVNSAPIMNNGRVEMWAGYPYTFTPSFSDPDGDPVRLRIVDGEPWMSIVEGNKLRLAPGRHDVGRFRVTIEASDGQDTDRGTYEINVKRFRNN